jgi:hypothetical protein
MSLFNVSITLLALGGGTAWWQLSNTPGWAKCVIVMAAAASLLYAINGLPSTLASLGNLAAKANTGNVSKYPVPASAGKADKLPVNTKTDVILPAKSETADFEIENGKGYALTLHFFGKDGLQWSSQSHPPGDRRSYRIACVPGEQIWYRAVDANGYWSADDSAQAICGGATLSKRLLARRKP